MRVNEIRVVFPDGIDIPDDCEPVADMTHVQPDGHYVDNSRRNCVTRWVLQHASNCKYPVLRRKWQAPERLRDGCKRLSRALSRIDYMLEEPNDMECSTYDVQQDENAVVERVRKTLERLKLLAAPEPPKPEFVCPPHLVGFGLLSCDSTGRLVYWCTPDVQASLIVSRCGKITDIGRAMGFTSLPDLQPGQEMKL